jgi:hypothetical protein
VKDGSGKPGARWGARGARTWNGQPDPAGGFVCGCKKGHAPGYIGIYITFQSVRIVR